MERLLPNLLLCNNHIALAEADAPSVGIYMDEWKFFTQESVVTYKAKTWQPLRVYQTQGKRFAEIKMPPEVQEVAFKFQADGQVAYFSVSPLALDKFDSVGQLTQMIHKGQTDAAEKFAEFRSRLTNVLRGVIDRQNYFAQKHDQLLKLLETQESKLSAPASAPSASVPSAPSAPKPTPKSAVLKTSSHPRSQKTWGLPSSAPKPIPKRVKRRRLACSYSKCQTTAKHHKCSKCNNTLHDICWGEYGDDSDFKLCETCYKPKLVFTFQKAP